MGWWLRQPRLWLAVACVVVSLVVTAEDDSSGWGVFVGLVVTSLAVLTLGFKYDEDHPHRAAERAAKQQAEVDKILWRYEREAAARARAAAAAKRDDAAH